MNCSIRQEIPMDFNEVNEVIQSAFYREDKEIDFNEWKLVEKIRESDYYINELSLVAEMNKKVVGHILFTPMKIKNSLNTFDSLALAPISVHKDYQNKGIGKLLVQAGIKNAKELGYDSIIVMGHPNYYPKFGFELASKWKIGIDDNFTNDYLFALELYEEALSNVNGIIKYCKPFYNENGELI